MLKELVRSLINSIGIKLFPMEDMQTHSAKTSDKKAMDKCVLVINSCKHLGQYRLASMYIFNAWKHNYITYDCYNNLDDMLIEKMNTLKNKNRKEHESL